jgi:transposase InsO family protein
VPGGTSEDRVAAIAALRRLRMTALEISELLAMPASTVSAVLLRIGLGKRSRLEPLEPANRYQRERPGELVHIDVKKLGRIQNIGHRITGNRSRDQRPHRIAGRKQTGWEYVQVCVDDATRLAYVEVLADERGQTVTAFLRRAVAFYARHGIHVERVMTDNGAGYRSILHALTCRALGLRHLCTQPYRPRTNGKAELGLRRHLRHLSRTNTSPPRLARSLQSPPTTPQPQPPATPHPPPADEQQRSWVLHLARRSGRQIVEVPPAVPLSASARMWRFQALGAYPSARAVSCEAIRCAEAQPHVSHADDVLCCSGCEPSHFTPRSRSWRSRPGASGGLAGVRPGV